MSETASTLPAFLDALVAALKLRAGLDGVNVFSCPVDPADLGKEAIELAAEVAIEQAPAAMSSTALEESYVVPGSILVYEPLSATSATAIETAAKAARDRADAILGEVLDELNDNDTMSGTVRDITVTGQVWHQGMAPEGQLGRSCWVEFTIQAVHEFTP